MKPIAKWMTASACAAAAMLAACGSSSSSGSGSIKTCGSATSGGGLLQPFTAPCADQGGNAILVSASGEVLALGGYNFPPASPDDVAFVDGWEIRFSKMLVTFDRVTLSQNPDLSPTDQSQTGALVAQEDGPWAVDLHKGGPLSGKGGSDEQAVPITAFVNQNMNGNAAFDPTQRYAFGFEVVPATASAKNVNLDTSSDSTDLQDYQEMITKGYTALFVGTATFRGTSCSSPPGSPAYDFSKLPTVINFRLGFTSPTTYVNCQNPDNDPATAFGGEEHERGVAVKSNATVTAQATFHTDHPFWDSFIHDSPAHFDQIAAQYVGVTSPTATLEDMASVKTFSTGFTDKDGAALPWRSCLSTYTPPDASAMHFDVQGRSVNTSATVAGPYLRDYRDYMTFNESTFGHLNADGLCFVKRDYPSAN